MFSKRSPDDFRDEVQSHLALEADRLVADGMSPDDAAAAARRRFGNATATNERFYEASRLLWLDHFRRDVRYAWRGLLRAPSFVATTALTLAVGIGLLTIAFAFFNGFLRPYAVRDPGSLYQIAWRAREAGSPLFRWSDYEALRRRTDLFAAVVGEDARVVSSGSQPVLAAVVSLNYFDALEPTMQLGRGLSAIDAGADAAVLSDGAWQRIFDRDRAVLGRGIELNGRMFAIVGVLGPDFSGLGDEPHDVFVPQTINQSVTGEPASRAAKTMVLARLATGVNEPRAEGALAEFVRSRADAAKDAAAVVTPHPAPDRLTVQMIAVLMPVFVPFVLVLVTACANVSNVMLARAIKREREIAVRLSFGASRARVIAQLLTEGACIAAMAGVAGLALAAWGLRLAPTLFLDTLPPSVAPLMRLPRLDFDARVFLFTVAVCAVATMLFALAPALQASRVALMDALRGQRHGSQRGSRLRHVLVVAQVAAALVLVVSAITLARNGAGISTQDLGFDVSGVMSINVRGSDDTLARPLAAALADDPRVAELAVTSGNPLFNSSQKVAAVPADVQQATTTDLTFVSPEFFSILRVPIDRGRGFTATDAHDAARVAIVTDATARAFWPGQDPIGKTIRLERADDRRLADLPDYPSVTVIGTIRDMTTSLLLAGHDRVHMFLPIARTNAHATAMLIRPRADRDLTASAFRDVFRRVASEPESFEALPLAEMRDLQMWPLLAASWVGAFLAVIALGLSVSGLYGVLTYALSDSQREIGIRMALGASRRGIVALVLRQGGALATMGAIVGLALAFAGLGTLAALVHFRAVNLLDFSAFAAGLVLVVAATLVAAAQPALRATRVSPSETLRADA